MTAFAPALALIGPVGTPELIILAILGLLIFGKRLPEVGKSVGRGIVEFKRGLTGIDDDINTASSQPPRIESRDQATTGAAKQPESQHSTHSA